MEDNLPLVYSYLKKKYGKVDDDLKSLCHIRLIECIETWDPERCSFSTWAYLNFQWAIAQGDDGPKNCPGKIAKAKAIHVSLQDTAVRGIHGQIYTYEEILEDPEGGDFAGRIIDEAYLRQLMEDANLIYMEKRVIELYYFQNMTSAKVGEQIGKTTSRASQIKNDALKKLKKAAGIQD